MSFFSTHFTASLTDKDDENGDGFPKFKSVQPPCPPFSNLPSFSHDFFAFTAGLIGRPTDHHLLDSPLLFASSHVFPCPMTRTILPTQSYNWNPNNYNNDMINETINPYLTRIPNLKSSQSNHHSSQNHDQIPVVKQISRRRSEDGYNWRKYGQKQVKGSVNPRSYYKCSCPDCPTKKKIERSAVDGHITEIVYKGNHNHPKPKPSRRNTVITNFYSSQKIMMSSVGSGVQRTQEDSSSVSFENHDHRQFGPLMMISESEDHDLKLADAKYYQQKQLQEGGESDEMLGFESTRGEREPKVVVQTTSDDDILDDGYRWRKYGRKVVKGNPNPRNYYKCTTMGCPVRKLVERASHDLRAVITTYVGGRHNHQVPVDASRSSNGGGSFITYRSPSTVLEAADSTPLVNYVLHRRELYDQHGRHYIEFD